MIDLTPIRARVEFVARTASNLTIVERDRAALLAYVR